MKTRPKKNSSIPLLKEDDEQIRFVAWLRRHNILHFAIPNGARRSLAHAIKMKKTGLVSGVPDLMIPIPNRDYCGLFIEMKTLNGGIISETQKYWIDALNMNKYKAIVAKGNLEAIKITEEYLEIKK